MDRKEDPCSTCPYADMCPIMMPGLRYCPYWNIYFDDNDDDDN